MKTSEFFRKIKALGLKIDNCNGDLLIGDTNRNYCHTSSGERYKIEIYHDHLEKLEEETRHKLLDLVVEYAKTPIEERVEPKKYRLRAPEPIEHDSSYLNLDSESGTYFFGGEYNGEWFKTVFTLEEIKNIPNQEFIKTLIKEEVR